MAMISGMQASRVISPITINIAQKNSAKMVRAIETGGPMLKGSEKLADLAAKFISLLKPCGIISPPTVSLSSKMAKEKAASEYPVLKSFFIGFKFFSQGIPLGTAMLKKSYEP